jgi:hypothetical protein
MATSYNCVGATDSSYGAGNYSTCTTGQTVGAPNTGLFGQFLGSGSLTILVPFIVAIVIVVIATVFVKRRKLARQEAIVESLSPSRDE